MVAATGGAGAVRVVSVLALPSCVPNHCALAGTFRFPRNGTSFTGVRCDAVKRDGPLETIQKNVPGLTGIREAVDESTKQELTRSDIEKHQAETKSEKESVLGARPASTVPWPRPEIERRPETGDRSFGSIFAIDGPAPETINGRMAMVGIIWALVAERLTGLTVMEQLFNPITSGLLYFGAVVQLFTIASVIPILNGESTDARRWGPFNAKAERWNGRLAMIGFAALIIDELIRHAPLIQLN